MISAGIWIIFVSLFYRVSGNVAPNITTSRSSSIQTSDPLRSETSTSSTSSGLGQYIASGLGGGSSASTRSSASSSSRHTSSVLVTAQSTDTRYLPGSLNSNTTLASTNDTNIACQASSVSWYLAENSIESDSANYYPVSEVFSTTYAGGISYGNADVYTTLDAFPHAHGNFTVTRTSPFTTASTWSDVYQQLKDNVSYPPSPDCTIAASACSSMYRSYRSSLGIAPTAPIPVIYPIPTNSPQCYDPQSAAALSTFNASTLPCDISGTNVQLFYWAPATDGGNASVTTGPSVVTTVYKNVTMTSPSIYLSFDRLEANRLVTGHENQYIQVGKIYTNPPLVSIDPSELSTLTKTISGEDMASVVDQIAHGGPDYLKYVSLLYLEYFDGGQNNYSAVPVNGANIATPDPLAYYLGGGWSFTGPPGCQTGFSQPECGTIFDDPYRAQLAVPREVRDIDPAWATCNLPLFGVYDPPHVLEPASSAAEPTPLSTPPVQTPSPGSPVMTSIPHQTGGSSQPIAVTVHTENPATGGLQLPSPTPGSAAADSDPSAGPEGGDPSGPSQGVGGAGGYIPHSQGSGNDPSPGSGGNSGSSRGSGSDPGPNGSQGPGNGQGSGSGQDSGKGRASDNGQASGAKQGSGSDQDPSAGQFAGAAANAGGMVASIVHGPGPSAQGNDDPGRASLGPQGQDPAGQIGNDYPGSNEGNPAAGSSGLQTSGQGGKAQGGSVPEADNQAAQAADGEPPRPVAIIGGQTISPGPTGSGIEIDGSQLSQGGVTKIAGTPISYGPAGLVIGSGAAASTIPIPQNAAAGAGSDPSVTPIATVAGQVLSANPSDPNEVILPNGQTISEGGAAATFDGSQISVGPGGKLVIAGSSTSETIALPTQADMLTRTAAVAMFTGTDGASITAIETTIAGHPEVLLEEHGSVVASLTVGGAAATVDGEIVSAGPGGIAVEKSGAPPSTIPFSTVSATESENGASSSALPSDSGKTGAGAHSSVKTTLLTLTCLIMRWLYD